MSEGDPAADARLRVAWIHTSPVKGIAPVTTERVSFGVWARVEQAGAVRVGDPGGAD